MANETLRVDGLKELEDALGELSKATGKNVLRRALLAAARPIEAQAKELAPVKFGYLKRSIGTSKVSFSSGNAGKRAFAEAMARGASRSEAGAAAREANVGAAENVTSALVLVGPGRRRQAGMQEFGTVKNRPHPYLRPAWDANRISAVEIIATELKVEIDKAAARAARKAARLLAKQGAT